MQSLAQSPEARLKILERDGLKLLYSLLDRAFSPDAVAGCSGTITHLGRAAKVQLHKFVQVCPQSPISPIKEPYRTRKESYITRKTYDRAITGWW
jgi:hypothetical protein